MKIQLQDNTDNKSGGGASDTSSSSISGNLLLIYCVYKHKLHFY
jgi:hypothetical protein